jgi:arylsulfatase A-like enzyme
MEKPDRQFSWRLLFAQTIFIVFAYAFMEWLFFVTKPSFMDAFPLGKKLEILLLAALLPALAAVAILIVLRILAWIPGPSKRLHIFVRLGTLLPSLVAAVLSILLLDNFTKTLFQVGIVTSRNAIRAGYGILAVILLVLWYRHFLNSIRFPTAHLPADKNPTGTQRLPARNTIQVMFAIALLLASLYVGITRIAKATEILGSEATLLDRSPHIILIGGDGTTAFNMSLYGYERDTTPNLVRLAETGLLAENNFTNSSSSTGSIVSIMTGKYPADTRVLYSPNILQGEDAIQHLPGILQRAGYATVQIGFPYYVDAYDVNLQEGFDTVNGRSLGQSEITSLSRQYHLEDLGYFLPRLWERITDRALHIFFIREMEDPYLEAIQAVDPNTLLKITDRQRIDQLITLILTTDTPLFVHVHLMDTHGPRFYPPQHVFSAGENQDEDWMTDFFDDSVLGYDALIGRIMNVLESDGVMDQTIWIVYSDHANGWRADDRIPLLFHFPNGDFAGRITDNTSNIDIAPTVLDYLGMETPSWMSGKSLIDGKLSPLRPIFSAGVVGVQCEPPDWWCEIDNARTSSAFKQFGYIQLVVCQGMYRLDLVSNNFTAGLVPEHTNPCSQAHLLSEEEARQMILDYLRTYGFDVSSLE